MALPDSLTSAPRVELRINVTSKLVFPALTGSGSLRITGWIGPPDDNPLFYGHGGHRRQQSLRVVRPCITVDRTRADVITIGGGTVEAQAAAKDTTVELVGVAFTCMKLTVTAGTVRLTDVRIDGRGETPAGDGDGATVGPGLNLGVAIGGADQVTAYLTRTSVLGFGVYDGSDRRSPGVAASGAAAIFAVDCEFSSNNGVTGGGVAFRDGARLQAVACQFDFNSARLGGAGLVLAGGSTAVLDTCTFNNNEVIGDGADGSAVVDGGAGLWADGASTVTAAGCQFARCSSVTDGGAIKVGSVSTVNLRRSAIHENTAAGSGGAGIAMYNSKLNLYAVTIFENTCTSNNDDVCGQSLFVDDGSGAGSEITIYNSILWGSAAVQTVLDGLGAGSLDATYSDARGFDLLGNGGASCGKAVCTFGNVIDKDPQLVLIRPRRRSNNYYYGYYNNYYNWG